MELLSAAESSYLLEHKQQLLSREFTLNDIEQAWATPNSEASQSYLNLSEETREAAFQYCEGHIASAASGHESMEKPLQLALRNIIGELNDRYAYMGGNPVQRDRRTNRLFGSYEYRTQQGVAGRIVTSDAPVKHGRPALADAERHVAIEFMQSGQVVRLDKTGKYIDGQENPQPLTEDDVAAARRMLNGVRTATAVTTAIRNAQIDQKTNFGLKLENREFYPVVFQGTSSAAGSQDSVEVYASKNEQQPATRHHLIRLNGVTAEVVETLYRDDTVGTAEWVLTSYSECAPVPEHTGGYQPATATGANSDNSIDILGSIHGLSGFKPVLWSRSIEGKVKDRRDEQTILKENAAIASQLSQLSHAELGAIMLRRR